MRRVVLSMFLVPLVAAAGYTAYWFILADRLKDGIGPWAELQRAQGYTLHWESLVADGYPGAFRLRFGHATAIGNSQLPLEIAAPELSGEAMPWSLQRWRVSAPQGIGIAAPGEGGGLKAGTLEGSVASGGERGTAIDLIARQVVGTGFAAGFAVASAEADLTLAEHAPAEPGDAAIGAAFRLTTVTLAAPMPPFGGTIEALSLAATMRGALPPGRPRDAVALWQQRGGTVEITSASLRWGALAVDASGTLALDEHLQPVGTLTATIESDDATIDALAALGKLRPGDVALVKNVVGLMATSGADGKKRLTLPVTLKSERLYLGPVQIAALPRITWE
jgi:hypothetical protein